MIEITLANFIQKYEEGRVSDIIVIKDRIYGKESSWASKIPSKQRPPFRIVWALVP